MLYLVGLGLADETDITVKGLNVVKTAERVYLEAYTSILLVDKERLVFFICPRGGGRIKVSNEFTAVGGILWPLCHLSRPRNG